MAIKKHASVYGVVELNYLAAVRTGQIQAQFELDEAQFSAATPAQNGMLLFVDNKNKKVKLPAGADVRVGLHASVEKDYENKGRKHFSVKPGEFLPRIYDLAINDTFETNAFQYDDTVFQNYLAIASEIEAGKVYGVASTNGFINVSKTSTASAVIELEAVEAVTLPNGETGIKWVVIKA